MAARARGALGWAKVAVAGAAGFAAGVLAAPLLEEALGSGDKRLPPSLRGLCLHVYEHCPFCVRVQLLLGWKGITYTLVVHGYGDALGDESAEARGAYPSATRLTGKKMLPVLELADGTMLDESGDIIAFVEDATGPGNVLLPPPSGRHDLKEFFASGGAFKTTLKSLRLPRQLRMTHVRDWSTKPDRDYARRKYASFSFDDAAAMDAENRATMEALLRELNHLLRSHASFNGGPCGLTTDDLHILPDLKTLSCVEGLAWPSRLRAYVEECFARAGPNVRLDFNWQPRHPPTVSAVE